MTNKPERPRLTPEERLNLGTILARKYVKGATVRELAAEYGRSFFWAHQLLAYVGCPMRPTGVRKGTKQARR